MHSYFNSVVICNYISNFELLNLFSISVYVVSHLGDNLVKRQHSNKWLLMMSISKSDLKVSHNHRTDFSMTVRIARCRSALFASHVPYFIHTRDTYILRWIKGYIWPLSNRLHLPKKAGQDKEVDKGRTKIHLM